MGPKDVSMKDVSRCCRQNLTSNVWYKELMKWADQFRTLKVRTNADTP